MFAAEADDYVNNISTEASLRVLLLSRVATGKAKVLQYTDTSLTGPPSGYDSVLGLPGEDLKYEETVVYTDDAIRPAYVLVYGDPPVLKQDVRVNWAVILKKLFTTPLAT